MKKKLPFIILFLFGSVLGICVGLAVFFVSFLRTPAGSRYLVTHLQTYLEKKANTKFEFKVGTIDPFSSIHFEDLKIIQESPQKVEFSVKSLDIRYSIFWLARILEIDHIQIEHPRLIYHTQLLSAPPLLDPPAGHSGSMLLPPVSLRVREFSLKNLELDFSQKTPTSELSAKLRNFTLNMSLDFLVKRKLLFSGDFSLDKSSNVAFSSSDGKSLTRASPFGRGKWVTTPDGVKIQLYAGLDRLVSPPSLPKPTQCEIDSTTLLSTDLKEIEAQGKALLKIGTIRSDIGFQIQAPLKSNEAPWKLKLNAEFPELAKLFFKKSHPLPWKVSLETETEWAPQRNRSGGDLKFNGSFRVQNQYGSWLAQNRLKLKAQAPLPASTSAPAVDWMKQGVIQLEGTTTISQEGGALLQRPMVMSYPIQLNHGRLQIGLDVNAPSFEIPHFAKVQDTQCSVHLDLPDLAAANRFEFTADLKQGTILLNQQVVWLPSGLSLPSGFTFGGLDAKIRASVDGENRFALKECTAEFNHSMIHLEAEAIGDSKAKNFQTQGSMILKFSPDFPRVAGQSLEGRVEFPWKLAIYHGRKINFEGNMIIPHLSWSKRSSGSSLSSLSSSLGSPEVRINPGLKSRVQEGRDGVCTPPLCPAGSHPALKGEVSLASMIDISGKVPVSEQLLWDGENIKFANLIQQNPFERVDFERLQPMLQESEQLKINEIGFEEKVYGPFQGFFSMRQNMIFAHRFDLKLVSGRTTGEMYLDTYPSHLQAGLLSRLTGLDLGEILPKKYLVEAPKGDQKLSGRSGMVINLNTGSLDGRVDITQIGSGQLLTLMNVVDPTYENEKINRARFALGIAHPSFVQMSFQKGYMDMNVKLDGAVSYELPLRGIPISAWISDAAVGVVKKTREGPLK